MLPSLVDGRLFASQWRSRRFSFWPGLVNGLQQVQFLPGSEDRQWIKRRTRSQRDPQWGSREQKFIAIQLPRMLDGSFEIKIVENVDAHRGQRQFMKRGCKSRRKDGGHHVIRPVATDEGDAAFFQEVCNVGVIT